MKKAVGGGRVQGRQLLVEVVRFSDESADFLLQLPEPGDSLFVDAKGELRRNLGGLVLATTLHIPGQAIRPMRL